MEITENKTLPYIICTTQYRTDTTFFPKGYVTYASFGSRYGDNWRRATQEEVEAYKKGETPKISQTLPEDKKIGSGLWQNLY